MLSGTCSSSFGVSLFTLTTLPRGTDESKSQSWSGFADRPVVYEGAMSPDETHVMAGLGGIAIRRS